MFNNNPYRRHSVWVDVFGIVLFGAVLLGGAGYLLYEATDAAPDLATGPSQGRVLSAQRPRGAASRPRPSLRRGNAAPSGSGVRSRTGRVAPSAVPFSKSWRKRATPDLAGPSSLSGNGQGSSDGAALTPSGPAIASSPSSVGLGGGGAQMERGNGSSSWQAEVRRFAGKARALSRQLGRRAHESSNADGSEASSSSRKAPTTASASANSGPGTPGAPEQAPIGGLGWLAAAGAAYALRRLGLQSGEE